MKRTFVGIFVLALSFLFVPIAYSSNTDINTIQIKMGDFYFKPETIHLRTGQHVKIELINEGKLEHEFMVGNMVNAEGEEEKQEMSERELKHREGMQDRHKEKHELGGEKQRQNNVTHVHTATFQNDFFEGIEVAHTEERGKFIQVAGQGTMLILEPGGNATLSFQVPDNRKGEWAIACFMPGHYEAEMKGKIIIK